MSEPWELLRDRGGWTEDRLNTARTRPIGFWNTWSNLAYAIAGCWLAWRYQDASSAAMAVALWLLATGSALYHAFKTYDDNRLDWMGMYAVFGTLVVHGVVPEQPWVSWAMLCACVLAVGWFGHRKWMQADWHMGAMLVLGSIRPVWDGKGAAVAVVLAIFVVAYAAWHLDKRHSKLVGRYGHALWHVFTALAIALLYIVQR